MASSGTVSGAGRGAFAVFLASGLALGIGFLTSLVTARTLGPSGQGVLSAIRTTAAIASTALGVGGPAAMYYLASVSAREVRPLVGYALIHSLLMGGTVVALAALFGDGLSDAQEAGDPELYLLGALLVPLSYLEHGFLYTARGLRRTRVANIGLVAARSGGLLAAIALVVVLDLGVAGALAAFAVVSLVQIVVSAPVAAEHGRPRVSAGTVRRMLSFGARAQVGHLLRLGSLRFDVLLLSLLTEPRLVGFYAVAQLVGELVLLVPQAFGWILAPAVASGEARPDETHRMLRVSGTLALLAVVAIGALGPLLIVFGYGDAFGPAVVPLLILLPGLWMFACGELVSFVLEARNRPGTSSWLAAYAGVTTIALDLVLIPLWDIEGAALASCLAYASFGLLSLRLVGRSDGVPLTRLLIARPAEVRELAERVRGRLRTDAA